MRVLIIEDDSSTQILLMQVVKRLWPQAKIEMAANSFIALDLWSVHGADLILLDWNLPGLSGIEVLKQIRKSGEQTICVMISGRADREAILAARTYQVAAYIVKPFKIKQVMERLAQLFQFPATASTPNNKYPDLNNFIQESLTKGVLGLPIDPDLVKAIEEIRALNEPARLQLLQRCENSPALVFRALSLANSGEYLQGTTVVETFADALQRIGIDSLVNLAAEISLHPGSALENLWIQEKFFKLQQDSELLINIIIELNKLVEFELQAAKTACAFYRVGEFVLLQLMQDWINQNNALDPTLAESLLRQESSVASARIKNQWNLPQIIRARIGAIYTLPANAVRKEQIVMRIAGLLFTKKSSSELTRLLARLNLLENQIAFALTERVSSVDVQNGPGDRPGS